MNHWFAAGQAPGADDCIKSLLQPIPAMLRRRFTAMGRIAAAGALSVLTPEQPVLTSGQAMPMVFAVTKVIRSL